MSTRQAQHRTDYRVAWWFSLGWTVVLAVTLWYVALRSDQTIAEVLKAERMNGIAFLTAGWLSAWGMLFLGGGSVRITHDRIYVRRFRDRLFGRTLEIRVDDVLDIEEVYRAAVRSRVLRITTTDERHIDIQHHMLRQSADLRSALFDLRPAAMRFPAETEP